MKHLYRLTQIDNRGYDTYDSCVVCEYSKAEAIMWHPNGNKKSIEEFMEDSYYDWANKLGNIECECIGFAIDGLAIGVICSSFNAG